MLRRSVIALPWWNFKTEHRQHHVLMYGGSMTKNTKNATHRGYVRRFRLNAFPNRTRKHWQVAMTGVATQRPRRLPWPYDLSSLIFNQPRQGSDKIGYVVQTNMLKTAVVAANYMVFYPKFNQRVTRTNRYFAHDEDMACVEGDLVHIKGCRKISKYKNYYVFSILEPNIEGRERLKLGLRTVPPPLFGYPVCRRIVKLNLTDSQHSKEKLAAAIQEHVQDAYRFAGPTGNTPRIKGGEDTTFDDVHRLVAPNAAATPSLGGGAGADGAVAGREEFTELEHDARQKKGEEYWMNQQPPEKYDFKNLAKSP